MPIYEYVCKSCSEHHEVLQKISDATLVKCPSCGKERLEKLISRSSFRLSGSGWYETDFKTDNQRNLTQDAGTSSSDSTKKNANSEKTDTAVKTKSAKSAKSDKTTSSSKVAEKNGT